MEDNKEILMAMEIIIVTIKNCLYLEKTMSTNYIYAGNLDRNIPSIFINDDDKSRVQALRDGYNAFGLYRYSHIPENEKAMPIINGDLWIEIGGLDIYDIISCARDAITNLNRYFKNFTETSAAYFLNGTISCQICIPASALCDNTGHVDLPLVHKDMVVSMCSKYGEYKIFNTTDYNTYINMNLYGMRFVYLLRDVSSQLPNGQYRVQIPPRKFMDVDINELIQLTMQPYIGEIVIPQPPSTGMVELFQRSRMKFIAFESMHDRIESLTQCAFVDHCFNLLNNSDGNNTNVFLNSEAFSMFLAMLDKLGDKGFKIAHQICRNVDGLNDEKLSKLIAQSRDCLISCNEVKKHFNCPSWCNVDCPFDLKAKENNDIINADTHFDLRDDGL